MKILKTVTIFSLAAVLVAIAVVFSINGYHFNEEELLGNYCEVSEYGYSVDDADDYSFNEYRTLCFTGKYYHNLFKNELLFEVRDTDDQLYWVKPRTHFGNIDIKNSYGNIRDSVNSNSIYTTKARFFIVINSLVVLLIASPFLIGLTLCKNKKIFIILLSIIGAIILAALIFLVYTFIREHSRMIILLIVLAFISEFFTIIFII